MGTKERGTTEAVDFEKVELTREEWWQYGHDKGYYTIGTAAHLNWSAFACTTYTDRSGTPV